ncbi:MULTISPECIES: putative ATP-grasp-modified RiPP [Streptomyces]|uniref:ATP-grasp-modified RiPP n=2 Tax=Streptomyces TaxID=1883 RepID=A0ABS2V1E0_9ACTN|nr:MULTISPECIES: putative ATP-grasp-modified RiPP [Streptomyces]MBM9623267.1 putative ATP-grasp-modified RiPP [Streptomyces zhihengii]QNP61823.1 putative ATP-grasp-modified RiPP [Streptomyces genisteinicus]TXS52686.1 putative ATP-grasp-modified RiPP [Streptomyces sp. t39]
MKPFAWNYARPAEQAPALTAYAYDAALQLNVLSDGRPAIADRALMAAAGTTTSKAGSATHFDD